MLFHDTVSFGRHDEPESGHGGKPVDISLYNGAPPKAGLMAAIEDFLRDDPEGQKWELHESLGNNNGFTILKRKGVTPLPRTQGPSIY